MPNRDSQTFLHDLFLKRGDTPVAGGKLAGMGMSNLAGLALLLPLGNSRWKYSTLPLTATRKCAPLNPEGTPQIVSVAGDKNTNFAWIQHMLHYLAPNGSMSSDSGGEGDIRRALIEADLVEWMVALPGQLFTNTPIPACIWFLTKNKAKRSRSLRKTGNRACIGHSYRIDGTKTQAFSLKQ
jgi:hypothetical protein